MTKLEKCFSDRMWYFGSSVLSKSLKLSFPTIENDCKSRAVKFQIALLFLWLFDLIVVRLLQMSSVTFFGPMGLLVLLKMNSHVWGVGRCVGFYSLPQLTNCLCLVKTHWLFSYFTRKPKHCQTCDLSITGVFSVCITSDEGFLLAAIFKL